MGRRSVVLTLPTYAGIETCDVCAADMETVREFQGKNAISAIYPNYTLHVDGSDIKGDSESVTLCSLECLQKWIKNRRTSCPGLK